MTHEEKNLDSMLTTALEHKPQVQIPAHFTATVMRALPAATPQRTPAPQTARTIGFAAMALLGVAIVALPMRDPGSMLSWTSSGFLIEMLLAGELAALALWRDLWAIR